MKQSFLFSVRVYDRQSIAFAFLSCIVANAGRTVLVWVEGMFGLWIISGRIDTGIDPALLNLCKRNEPGLVFLKVRRKCKWPERHQRDTMRMRDDDSSSGYDER